MRRPKVENKYNLTPFSITKLKFNRKKVNETYFWRSNVLGAWCLNIRTAKTSADLETDNHFWLAIYDDGRIYSEFRSNGGIRDYVFNSFYDYSTIKQTIDLEIQEKVLEKINFLIDEGVFILP